MQQQNVIVCGLVASAIISLLLAGLLAMKGDSQASTAFLAVVTTVAGILVKSPARDDKHDDKQDGK